MLHVLVMGAQKRDRTSQAINIGLDIGALSQHAANFHGITSAMYHAGNHLTFYILYCTAMVSSWYLVLWHPSSAHGPALTCWESTIPSSSRHVHQPGRLLPPRWQWYFLPPHDRMNSRDRRLVRTRENGPGGLQWPEPQQVHDVPEEPIIGDAPSLLAGSGKRARHPKGGFLSQANAPGHVTKGVGISTHQKKARHKFEFRYWTCRRKDSHSTLRAHIGKVKHSRSISIDISPAFRP